MSRAKTHVDKTQPVETTPAAPTLKRPLKWFAFDDIDGAKWSVFISTAALTKDLAGDEKDGENLGITDFGAKRIYIEAAQTRKELLDTLLHEWSHVALRDARIPAMWQEHIISYMTPRVFHIMKQVGVRLPPIPPKASLLLKSESDVAAEAEEAEEERSQDATAA